MTPILIQDARARNVNGRSCLETLPNGGVIVRQRPRRTVRGFDHRRGMRALVDIGSCAMDADTVSSRRADTKGVSWPAERIWLIRGSEVMEPGGSWPIVKTVARQPRRYW